MTAELEAAANGEIDLLGRNEVGADIIAEIDDWLRLGFRLMSCGCLANKYGEAAHGPEDEHAVDGPMGGTMRANSLDPLRELAEWLTIECHLLEPVAEPRPDPALDEFRWALLDPEPSASASSPVALAHALRRAVDDTRLLATALGLVTAGPGEFASAWIEGLARLADESGDEFRCDYLIGFCAELGVELDDAMTDARLAGEALAGVLRREWSSQ